MKLSKKAVTALTFTLGTCIFFSTAFADSLIGSGYDRLKDTMKGTAAQMENGLGNYTLEAVYALKDNGQTLLQGSSLSKINTADKALEETRRTQYGNTETYNSYSYTDKKKSVYKSGEDEMYYVTEYAGEDNRREPFANPFKEEGAPEIEKIFDALMGSLKDYVQAEDRSDGGKVYSGSLTEAQVPALVNAATSFGMKRMIADENRSQREVRLPVMDSDIYVKKVTGTAAENKNGVLENMTGDVTLSGKDKAGVVHELTLSFMLKLSDVGRTVITLPDLTGAKVEKYTGGIGFSSMYIGTYKNDIILEKNGQFVKAGERILEITSVDQNVVKGRYHETVKPEFKQELPDPYDFNIEYATAGTKNARPAFTYTNAKGETENGQLFPSGDGRIYVNLSIEIVDENTTRSNSRPHFNGELIRVFE
ncbi:hypothetical protein [Gorillibacterium sp. sgz5001074]|uniref:hypothetical protein n=1 Tax=Gorillibacterium sp. sgz5001074 TaxID=3446695 RepID=UPI003F66B441